MRKWKKLTASVLVLCLLSSLSFPAAAAVTGGGPDGAGQVSLEAPGGGQESGNKTNGPSAGEGEAGQATLQGPPTGEGNGSQVTTTGPSTGEGNSGQVTTDSPPTGEGNSGQQVTTTGPSTGEENGSQVTMTGPSTGEGNSGQVTTAGPPTGEGNSGQSATAGPSTGTGSAGQSSSAGQAPGTGNAGETMPGGPSGENKTGQTGGYGSASGTAATGAARPDKPEIQAEGAVVIDAATGTILYGKNETSRFYPASITKLMTAMVVLERTNLNDVVTFSSGATTNLESGASTLNLTEGDQLTVEQCLYGLLLKSANEIGNALAEHVSGSVQGFAQLMNQKAAQLGCTGTHFANPHGLNDSNHYTTPYDMALIARAAFQNETLCSIDTTRSYQFPATIKEAARTITMGHKMMFPDDSRYYEGIIGGKTGYTSLAGNTLVTGAQRDGVRLVAVVMKSKSTHYADTKKLLDYGFAVMRQTTPASGWGKDDKGWYYILESGQRAAGQWLHVDQADYWIDADGYMATGWRRFAGGEWCYFRSNGARAVNYWVEDQGKWFYLGDQGVMLKNTRTPDGYQLGADGAWVQ